VRVHQRARSRPPSSPGKRQENEETDGHGLPGSVVAARGPAGAATVGGAGRMTSILIGRLAVFGDVAVLGNLAVRCDLAVADASVRWFVLAVGKRLWMARGRVFDDAVPPHFGVGAVGKSFEVELAGKAFWDRFLVPTTNMRILPVIMHASDLERVWEASFIGEGREQRGEIGRRELFLVLDRRALADDRNAGGVYDQICHVHHFLL